MSKKNFIIAWTLFLILMPILYSFTIAQDITWLGDAPGKTLKGEMGIAWSFAHSVLAVICWIFYAIVIVWGFVAIIDEDEWDTLMERFESTDTYTSKTKDPTNKVKSKWTLKRFIWIIALLIVTILIYKTIKPIASGVINVYNTSTQYHNRYNMATTERKGFYDKMWKIYVQKNTIAGINKEVFIEVSKIIMENRKDGVNLTWKWVQENQNIPYAEFSKFYADLSEFIAYQREAYFALEVKCQEIANNNNMLLDTFPNNLYNKIVHCKHITFKYGFLSDSTNTVFETGIENIK